MGFYTYKICNDVNSKVYVGCTTRPVAERLKGHIANCRNIKLPRTPQTPVLNQAMHDIGAEHFFIEQLGEYPDRAAMLAGERYWIRTLVTMEPHGYNTSIRKLSDEAIAIIKTNSLGLKQREYAAMFGVSVGTIVNVQCGRVGADVLPNYFDELLQGRHEKEDR